MQSFEGLNRKKNKKRMTFSEKDYIYIIYETIEQRGETDNG